MPDISKIMIVTETEDEVYDIKDLKLREEIEKLLGKQDPQKKDNTD